MVAIVKRPFVVAVATVLGVLVVALLAQMDTRVKQGVLLDTRVIAARVIYNHFAQTMTKVEQY